MERCSGARREEGVFVGQLDLPFWAPGTLREAIKAYLTHQCGELSEATIRDYFERGRWLETVLGEHTRLESITILRLLDLKREHGVTGKGLLNVTIRRRLLFLRSVLTFAAARGIIPQSQVFDIKLLKLSYDGKRGGLVHTPVQFQAFHLALPEARFRIFATVGFWTGHHTHDIFTMERWMLDPDREMLGEDGKPYAVGGYWRRNHKNRHCKPEWFPMAPAFREAVIEHYAKTQTASRNDLIVGRVWSLCKTFAAACDRAELPRMNPKGLRTSFSSNLLARGADEEFVRQALGQTAPPSRGGAPAKRASILHQHYAEVTPELLRRGYAALAS